MDSYLEAYMIPVAFACDIATITKSTTSVIPIPSLSAIKVLDLLVI